jgi:hypothetical protein
VREYTRRRPRNQRDLLDLDSWLLSNSGNPGRGGGNGGYSDCGACGHRCGDSVYGTYDHHHVDDVLLLTTSLHLLFE